MVIRRRMTITHQDFFRLLPRALGSRDYQRQGNSVSFRQPGFLMEINLSPERRWRIAGLELPATDVEIVLSDCGAEQAQTLLKQFDLAFHRGGG